MTLLRSPTDHGGCGGDRGGIGGLSGLKLLDLVAQLGGALKLLAQDTAGQLGAQVIELT